MLEQRCVPVKFRRNWPDTRKSFCSALPTVRNHSIPNALLPPEAAEMRVHVTVSQNGAVIGEDVLTPEHPAGQSFPAGRDSPTQFHFTVEQPGPSHQVTCWVKSENSGVTHTRAMGQGESDDLQARAQ